MRLVLRACSLLPVLLLAVPAALAEPETSPRDRAPNGANVVLLHGLGRSDRAMVRVERALEREGYAVHNLHYPSREAPLEELAAGVAEEVQECCADPAVPLHFVTHSMGGIVLRTLVHGDARPGNLGRVVMLAPPNQGSPWVDELRHNAAFQLAGPAAAQLGTDAGSAPRSLGPVDFELGVLAGNQSVNPVGSWLIPGADDGMVGVESTRVEGMADFREIGASHSLILYDEQALAEVVHFLAHGAFRPTQAGDGHAGDGR